MIPRGLATGLFIVDRNQSIDSSAFQRIEDRHGRRFRIVAAAITDTGCEHETTKPPYDDQLAIASVALVTDTGIISVVVSLVPVLLPRRWPIGNPYSVIRSPDQILQDGAGVTVTAGVRDTDDMISLPGYTEHTRAVAGDRRSRSGHECAMTENNPGCRHCVIVRIHLGTICALISGRCHSLA